MGSVEQPLELAPRPIQHVYSKRQKKKPTDDTDPAKKKEPDNSLASQENGAPVKPDVSSGGGTSDKAGEKSQEEKERIREPMDQEKLQNQHKSDGESEEHRNSKMSRLLEVATSEFHSEELLREGGEATANGGLKGYQRRRKRQIVQDGVTPAESSPRKTLDRKRSRDNSDLVSSDRVSNGAARDGDSDGVKEIEAEGGEEEDEYNGEEEEEEDDDEEGDEEEEEKRAPKRRGRARKAPSPKRETIKPPKRRPGRPRKVRPPPSPDNTTATTTTRNQKINASSKEALPQSSEDGQDENLSDGERLKRARGFKRVYRWLHDLELLKYAECFEKHEVEDDVLPLLTFDDLREMGVSAVGARRKMFTSIQDMELPRRKSR
ncbi:cilia- and flagella-associated protein 251-like [Selaginella moellendorffii]|uniref:cilia- and flagella-associated protein 251-like n=1 Tax=Selaginella moellendorffii TaxID=88036 RepID=UPI000D1CB14B|nr:cilia- and flagella-associated protein 251-like [Selaginella moellendorffii]XP_024528191.1 cilia- and flagella-associated protein 251-like [Selaginella moellendorffii]XP_024528192.1 cilia- and flagella-associated protein 251-like [Selaginella moellendorffii]|eukprot:XP_024528190.1 cilia- and flagella-associated protein 251-like [Selaginella moellendorffii]